MSIVADLPDYLPARMVNEFVYCPRLFYYEWVEGVFTHNTETVEGALRHAGIDARSDALAPPGELPQEERVHSRSVTLSSETHRLIATMDLVEAEGAAATPVDYKRGSPRKDGPTGEIHAWDTDRVQLAVQALVLRDNGYTCTEAVVYYARTKQRVRVSIDEPLLAETLAAVADARAAAGSAAIPPPLLDSPKCTRCSLVGICLPDETHYLLEADHAASVQVGSGQQAAGSGPGEAPECGATTSEPPANSPHVTRHSPPAGDTEPEPPRRLFAARDDLRPLYLSTQGLHVGKSGNVLKVKEKDTVVQEVRIGETCQVSLFGNIQLTTQALQALCEHEVPICFFSQGGWFYGVTHGLGVRNIALRREQFRLADDPAFRLGVARSLVVGKIRNQRTMLQRNHIEPPAARIAQLKCLCDDAEKAESLEQLLGLEGNAARIYFELFPGMIKVGDPSESTADCPPPTAHSLDFTFDFTERNRRPPRDPVNALLSLAYSVLAKDLTIVCHAVGFDPFLGYYHQPRFGRAPLALDLMEPFRPLIADSAVLSAINTRMVTPRDFIRTGQAVALRPEGRKAFFRAYEQRMDALVTHPIFGYRLNYRRLLEVQTRLLARLVTGEISDYPVFVTR